ncbi:hypothetical protein [Changpingibacter yushuensis]|uniref:hypothetical protein n=1 Tax=Changpingibacter yushuensis TaxID=2758440 RepID=UPI0015F785C1|nr:hypothetical protein [Changpingibacter yushuensis]
MVPQGLSHIEETLVRLAIDAYPSFLVKVKDRGYQSETYVSLFKNPLNKEFQEAVKADPVLRKLFREDDPNTGPRGWSVRSTRHGSMHQLWTLADTLIGSAWLLASSKVVHPTPDDLVRATFESLDRLLNALAGKPVSIPVRIGLTGVLLPPEVDVWELPGGRLRRADERDEPIVCGMPRGGKLSAFTQKGDEVVMNYGGDLVLELEIPYMLELTHWDVGIHREIEWPAGYRDLEVQLENIRLGLLLALPDLKPVIVPSWQYLSDPLDCSNGIQYTVVSEIRGLTPLQLNESQFLEWMEWTNRIADYRVPSIDIAIGRVLAAVSERHMAGDVLLDSVVVWENLFGGSGETTLKITCALAWLLGDSPDDRRARQSRYAKIYDVRSKVVHGSRKLKYEEIPMMAAQAVETAIEALRLIFSTNVNLLALSDSARRSLWLILQG